MSAASIFLLRAVWYNFTGARWMQWQSVSSGAFLASTWDWLIDRFHTLVIRSSCWLYTSFGVLSGSVSGDYSTWLTLGWGAGVGGGTGYNRAGWRLLCRSKYLILRWVKKLIWIFIQVLDVRKQTADCWSWLGAICTSEYKSSLVLAECTKLHRDRNFCLGWTVVFT